MKLQILNQFQTFEKDLGPYDEKVLNKLKAIIRFAEGKFSEWENEREIYFFPQKLSISGKLYKVEK